MLVTVSADVYTSVGSKCFSDIDQRSQVLDDGWTVVTLDGKRRLDLSPPHPTPNHALARSLTLDSRIVGWGVS